MTKTRRDFIKRFGLLGGAGMLISNSAVASQFSKSFEDNDQEKEGRDLSFKLSILQTTDVHCQIHPHDELFWENDQAVFRKTGGYAHLATYLDRARRKNENTFVIDSGDMFQGSELSVKTLGKAMTPILNALNYDLYLPGNWEVIYYKKAMQTLLGSLNAPKICANMFHDLGEGKRGELIFPAYHIWHVNGIKVGFLGYTDPLVPLR